MFTYTVHCPALNETEVCNTQDRAFDICWDMHDESNSYAWIEDSFGNVVGEYGEAESGVVINHQTIPCD